MKEPSVAFKGSMAPELPKGAPPPPVAPPVSPISSVAPVAAAATSKPFHAYRLFGAIFGFVAKKYPAIADDLELDQNDRDLLDEAFTPILKKIFVSLGVSEDYMLVLVAVMIVLVPRFIAIAGEVSSKHGPSGRERPSPATPPKKPSEERVAARPDTPPSALGTQGVSNWTWTHADPSNKLLTSAKGKR